MVSFSIICQAADGTSEQYARAQHTSVFESVLVLNSSLCRELP